MKKQTKETTKKSQLKTNEDGTVFWVDPETGKLHNENGPALILTDGEVHFYQDGVPHRLEGPAVTRANGDKFFYRNGVRHNESGSAIVLASGREEYWLYGNRCSYAEFVDFKVRVRS